MTNKHIPIKAKEAILPTKQDPFFKLKVSLGILIGSFAFIIYALGISNNYTADDHFVTDQNDVIKSGLAGIPTILSTDYLYGYDHGVISGPVYRPTSLIMFDLEWNLFPDNPHIFHFMNVLLFAITCWILFLLLCHLYEQKFKTLGMLFPFICAILYAAHPIHTEVVDNIKSRDEILCFLFGILSIFFVVKSVSNMFYQNLFLGCFFYFLSTL